MNRHTKGTGAIVALLVLVSTAGTARAQSMLNVGATASGPTREARSGPATQVWDPVNAPRAATADGSYGLVIRSKHSTSFDQMDWRAEVHALKPGTHRVASVTYQLPPQLGISEMKVYDSKTSFFGISRTDFGIYKLKAVLELVPATYVGSYFRSPRTETLEAEIPWPDPPRVALPAELQFVASYTSDHAGDRFRVRLEGPADRLSRVKQVEYTLPDSYYLHARRVDGRNGFEIKDRFDAAFSILARVLLEDGAVASWAIPVDGHSGSGVRLRTASEYMLDGGKRVAIWIDAAPADLARIESVEYTLDPSRGTLARDIHVSRSVTNRFNVEFYAMLVFTVPVTIRLHSGRVLKSSIEISTQSGVIPQFSPRI